MDWLAGPLSRASSSPRRSGSLCATMVPSGMATATNSMSGPAASSWSKTWSRTPYSLRMPERRVLSRARMSEAPFSSSRWVMAYSLRSMASHASRLMISTHPAPASARASGRRRFCAGAAKTAPWRAAWLAPIILPVPCPNEKYPSGAYFS